VSALAETTAVMVRGFGYDVVHGATVPATAFLDCAWPTPKYPFTGVATPIVARCGRQVRSVRDVVVVMQPGTTATCRDCVRWMASDAQAKP